MLKNKIKKRIIQEHMELTRIHNKTKTYKQIFFLGIKLNLESS